MAADEPTFEELATALKNETIKTVVQNRLNLNLSYFRGKAREYCDKGWIDQATESVEIAGILENIMDNFNSSAA